MYMVSLSTNHERKPFPSSGLYKGSPRCPLLAEEHKMSFRTIRSSVPRKGQPRTRRTVAAARTDNQEHGLHTILQTGTKERGGAL